MELEEMGFPRKITRNEAFEILSKHVRPKHADKDYAYFVIGQIREDLTDALKDPDIYQDCVESALSRLSSLTKVLKGDL